MNERQALTFYFSKYKHFTALIPANMHRRGVVAMRKLYSLTDNFLSGKHVRPEQFAKLGKILDKALTRRRPGARRKETYKEAYRLSEQGMKALQICLKLVPDFRLKNRSERERILRRYKKAIRAARKAAQKRASSS